MSFVPPASTGCIRWRILILLLPGVLLIGCQSYEAAPLDIHDYRSSFEDRIDETETVTAFAERLNATDEAINRGFDPSDGICSAEGEVLALFYNNRLRIARLEAGVALATLETAGLWDDPVFGFDAAEILSPTTTPFEWGAMGSLTIPISGRLDIEKQRAGAAYEAELRTIVDAEWRTRADLRKSWARWAAASEHLLLIDELIVKLKEINSQADLLMKAGEINRVERRLLKIELADRLVQASEVELQALNALNDLLDVMGLPPSAGPLLIPEFPAIEHPEVPNTTERLIQSNTELAVRFAEYETAEETLRLEIRKQFPDIVIGSGYGTQFNDQRVMFGLSIPIPILNANRAAIAEAAARREVVRAAAETTFESLYRELETANAALLLKQNQRNQYTDVIVPLLSAQNEDLRKIAELGELDMFVLLETVNRTVQTKQRLIDLRVEELDATIMVHEILGPAIPMDPAPTMNRHNTNTTDSDKDNTFVAGGRK
ncbi:MAG: hypothetical protein CMJ29_03580 [Phycisphaerae bacterium]|nr:hypothetical protein [Phycisphaerae bacterium]